MGTASLPFRSLATRSSGKGGRIPFRRCRITSNHRPSVASIDRPLGHEHDTTGFWNYSRCRWARVSDFIEREIVNSSSRMGLSHQAIERDSGRCRPSREAENPPAVSTSRCVRASGGHRMIAAFRTGRWPLEWFLEAIGAGVNWAIEQRAVFCFLAHPSCLGAVDPSFRTIDLICDRVRAAGDRAAIIDLDSVARRAKTTID
jgi:hypothetical protein